MLPTHNKHKGPLLYLGPDALRALSRCGPEHRLADAMKMATWASHCASGWPHPLVQATPPSTDAALCFYSSQIKGIYKSLRADNAAAGWRGQGHTLGISSQVFCRRNNPLCLSAATVSTQEPPDGP